MAYTTLAKVKAYLGIGTGETKDDTLLTDFVAQAQTIFEEECRGMVFEAAADTTRYFHSIQDVRYERLYFDRPLCQITSITNGDGVAVTSTQYVKLPNDAPWYAVELLASSGVAWTYEDDPENAIAVVGRWAYSVTAPTDVVWATTRLAAFLYKQREVVNAGGDAAKVSPSGVVMLPPKLPEDVLRVAKRYMRQYR